MDKRYRALVGQHKDQVFSLAKYMLSDASEAEDVAQEAFIKLWQQLERVRTDKSEAWLMKVTRNACLDRLRARKAQVGLEDESLHVNEREEPENILVQKGLQKRLMDCIQRLKEPWRSLLVLRDIHEHSYENVAEIMDLKPAQVKVYLHRARQALSEAFKQEN